MKRSHLLELYWKVYNCDSVEEKQDKGFTPRQQWQCSGRPIRDPRGGSQKSLGKEEVRK